MKNTIVRCVILPLLLLFVESAESMASVIRTIPDDTSPYIGQMVVVAVHVDLTGQNDLLGAYSLELSWNPLLLSYVSVSDGTSGFGSPNKNEENVGDGVLRINSFNAGGIGENVNIVNVSFTVAGPHAASDCLDVQILSLIAAQTFIDLRPEASVETTEITIDNETTLQILVNPSGNGTTVPGVGSYVYARGTVVNLSAAPSPGYQFVNWTGDVANPGSPSTTTIMNNTKTVTANFAAIQYGLTIGVNGQGSVIPAAGSYMYNAGTVVNLSAAPSPGYQFVNWTGDVANPGSPSTTTIMNNMKTVTANFAAIQYGLTIGVNGQGSVIPAAGSYMHNAGTVVNLSAASSPGYQFVNWTGDVANPGNPSTTTIMNNTKTVTANFAPQTFTLDISVEPPTGGITTPSAGNHIYQYGNTVSVAVAPSSGYRFLRWSDWIQSDQPVTEEFLISGNLSLVAYLAAKRIWGDVDDSYEVNIVDALKIATYQIDPWNAGLSSILGFIEERGDVNANGSVTSTDALICATYELLPENQFLGDRVGNYMAETARPAFYSPMSTRALVSAEVIHDGTSIRLIPTVTAETGEAIGAAAMQIKWDTGTFQYNGIGENNGYIVGLAGVKNGELGFSRFDVDGSVKFTFPEVMFSCLEGDKPSIEINLLSAALAGSFQELLPESTVRVRDSAIPVNFKLHQNVPNPFNPNTVIKYSIPSAALVRLEVYAQGGQLVKTLVDGFISPGDHAINWDGRDNSGMMLGSGLYFYKLHYNRNTDVKRMILLK